MITRDVTLVFYSMCFMFDGYFLLLILVFFVTVSNVKHIYKIDKMTISEKKTQLLTCCCLDCSYNMVY